MKHVLLLALFILTGCETTPIVKEKWPEAPSSLLVKCGDLKLLPDQIKLSDLARNITDNYSLYHSCSLKNELWIEWYSKQKKIFEDAHK